MMSWKVASWELPSSVCCIIRANTHKGKVKEFVYQKHSAAEAKVAALMHEGVEFTVCTDEAIHFVSPNAEDYDTDYD
jgi:intracellular sulfur oxidation DsrE/DsrF family protein